MKVVTLKQLCELPVGAIFSAFDPNIVEGLFCRGKVLSEVKGCEDRPDFFFERLLAEPKQHRFGEPPIPDDPLQTPFNESCGGERWGHLDPEELFVVYESRDLYAMAERLQHAAFQQIDFLGTRSQP